MLIDLQPAAGPALVVGGGEVAARRVKLLAEARFEIVVVAPQVRDAIRWSAHTTVVERPFESADIDLRVFGLVFACTDSREVNRLVGELARVRRIPVVVADAKEESTFYTPAILRDGGIAIAVSTGGASPSAAKQIRELVAASLGPGWGRLRALGRQPAREEPR